MDKWLAEKRICFNFCGHDLAFSPSWEKFCKILIKTWIMQNEKTAQKRPCIISPAILSSFWIHSFLYFSLTTMIMHQKKHSRNNAIITLILYLSYPILCFCTWAEKGSVQRLVSFCTSPSSNMFFGDIFCAITKKQLKEEISGLQGVTCGCEWLQTNKQTNKKRNQY